MTQETVTGIQHYSDKHQTTANDAASEQQSSVQHQPTPQYALLHSVLIMSCEVHYVSLISSCTYTYTMESVKFIHAKA